MKRQLMNILTIGLVATCGFVSAMDYCCPDQCCVTCDPCCMTQCGRVEVWADGLYLKPSSCNNDYVVTDRVNPQSQIGSIFPIGEEQGICPKYHWGFRVGASYFLPCSQIDGTVYYSRLTSSDRKLTVALGKELLWPSSVVAGFTKNPLFSAGNTKARAFSKVNQKWNAVDGEIGYCLNQGCRFSTRGHIGLHWAEIRIDRLINYYGDYVYSGSTNRLYDGLYTYHCETWGIGPRFGGDIRYDIGCGLGVVARASWGVLAGEIKHNDKAHYLDSPIAPATSPIAFKNDFGVKNKCRCVVFPEFDTSIGVNYTFNCNRCFEATFEIGWEFRTYLQSVVHSYYQDSNDPASSATVCDPFNLQGLYLRGIVRF